MNRILRIKSHLIVYAIGATAALSSFVIGYSHVFLSQMEKVIQKQNNLSLQQLAIALTIVVSATNLGEIIGPFLYKPLTQWFGQARTMITCNIFTILAIFIQLIELKVAYLIVGRIILGVIIGIMSSVLPLYLNSISPLSISGKICSLNQVMTCLGVIAAYLMGFLINQEQNKFIWRIIIAFPVIPSLLSIFSFRYLFPFDRIERHIQKNEHQIVQRYMKLVYSNATFECLKEQKLKSIKKQTGFHYNKEIDRYIIAIVTIASCQLCGINGIFYYAKQLFNQVTEGDSKLSQRLMVGLAFCQAITSLICSLFVDYFGRKYLLLKGQKALIFILFGIFVVDNLDGIINRQLVHLLIVALLYAHVITFNFSLGPICIIYAAQLVPNMTPIIVTLRSATFLVALTTNFIIHEFGIGQLFLMYGVLSVVAYTYLQTRLRETKGKSKPQIYDMFENEGREDLEQKATLT